MKKLASKLKEIVINRLGVLVVASVIIVSSVFLIIGKQAEDGSITLDGSKAKYSKAQEKALCELAKKRDDAIAGMLGWTYHRTRARAVKHQIKSWRRWVLASITRPTYPVLRHS